MLTADEAKAIVITMRSAPLADMEHAEAVDRMCAKVLSMVDTDETDPPPKENGSPATPTAYFGSHQ